jgi:hypothetical protein
MSCETAVDGEEWPSRTQLSEVYGSWLGAVSAAAESDRPRRPGLEAFDRATRMLAALAWLSGDWSRRVCRLASNTPCCRPAQENRGLSRYPRLRP